MITNDQRLRLAQDQLAQVSAALARLRIEHPTATPEWLAVLEEGFRNHAEQLRRQIAAYSDAAVAAESAAADVS